jgi:ABC-type sugar transport system ATPase subunit
MPGPARSSRPPDGPLLVARGLAKRYGAVAALDSVDFVIEGGKVHALVGSNGAGKSTLIKILTGAVVPDAGEIRLNGKDLPTGEPRQAILAGIACVYQQSNLVPALSVLDNILLGQHRTRRFGRLDRVAQRTFVDDLLRDHDIELDLDVPVRDLSTVQQKEVEIAKALSLDARIILMDEPTAWLSGTEVAKLFGSIRRLCDQGVAVVYISHVLDEIFEIAHRVTVLRDGRVAMSGSVAETSRASLVRAMLGRELLSVEHASRGPLDASADAPVALECRGLARDGVFHDIDLQVRRGEIVSITGLVGARRSELVRCLFGADTADRGEILIRGQRRVMSRPADAIREGIGFVPEDRHRDGLFEDLSVGENIALASLSRFTRRGAVSRRLMRSVARDTIERLGIVPPRAEAPVRSLSGGNQQKTLLGRWLAADAIIIILDEPTVGVDVGAKADIYRQLRQMAGRGAAILLVSSDLEEVLAISDRVVVMAAGRIVATFPREEATQDLILHAAGGSSS